MALDRNGKEIQIVDPETGAAYVFDGCQLVDQDGDEYVGGDEWLASMKAVLISLLEMGGDPAADIHTAINSRDKTVTFVLGADPQEGTGHSALPDLYEGIGRGFELATFEGIGVSAIIHIDFESLPSDPNEFVVTIAHENRHAYHLLTGTRDYDSERQGLLGENAVRYVLGMPMRLHYGLNIYDESEVVPSWAR